MINNTRGLLLVTFCIAAFHTALVFGGDAKLPKITRGMQMDYGPFLAYMAKVALPPGAPKESENVSPKALTIKLSKDTFITYDTDVLRVVAAWKGEPLDISKTNIGDLGGKIPAVINADLMISTSNRPGWSGDAQFTDPRETKAGPLPREFARYSGLYVHGEKVVLSYKVGDAEILELPGAFELGGRTYFTRTLQISKSSLPLNVLLSEGAKVGAAIVKSDIPASTHTAEGKAWVSISKCDKSAQVTMLVYGAGASAEEISAASKQFNAPDDLRELCKGSPSRLGAPTVTNALIGKDEGPYVVDTFNLPENTPANSWMRPSGFDFYPDGRVALCTLNGEIWIVSGIDAKLEQVSWKRYAIGMFEPLGVKIVDGVIYVLCRDQITRLHDLNSDGEADYYENFNNDTSVHAHYHTFAFDLQTDRAGNFYFIRGGNWVPQGFQQHGLIKVSKDGKTSELISTGFRAPNGISIGPNDEITCADNQGHWIPASKINLLKPGGFYGHCGDPRTVDFKNMKNIPTDYIKPIWVPYAADNSSGGQVWVTSDKWGPFKNHLLHMSYGKCSLFHVMTEEVNGQFQGGTVKFPISFASGIMRGRFNPVDGQLYVCGLKGWQSSAGKDGTFSRVRYTGKPVHMPLEMHATRDTVTITFTSPLDKASATDDQSYGVQQWNYKWASEYGSKDYSVEKPGTIGRDTVAIKGVTLSDDRKTVTLQIPGLKPVMQMHIQCKIKAEDGSPVVGEIFNTINALP